MQNQYKRAPTKHYDRQESRVPARHTASGSMTAAKEKVPGGAAAKEWAPGPAAAKPMASGSTTVAAEESGAAAEERASGGAAAAEEKAPGMTQANAMAPGAPPAPDPGRKLVFLDIDGTFTAPGQNRPPDSAIAAVRQARERGHLVMLCSGRTDRMLSPVLEYGFDGYIACSGGRIVLGDTVIYDSPISALSRTWAEEILRRNGIYLTVECRDGSYTDEAFKTFLKTHAAEGKNSELLRWRRQIESELSIQPMSEYDEQPVYKMVLMMRRAEQLDEPMRLLSDVFTFCIQDSDSYGIVNAELVKKDVNKGRAIERVCRHLNISVSDTIAFGDSMNDKEMLETAGLSVCMGNGSEALKKIADLIAPQVDADGLSRAFAECGLTSCAADRRQPAAVRTQPGQSPGGQESRIIPAMCFQTVPHSGRWS